MAFVYVCSLQQNATWLLKRNAGKTTQEAIEITHIHHILWLVDQNARLYSSAYALVCLYFSPEAFMLLIWQANQHSCSVTSQITIKTPPVSADSTLKRYKDCIYCVTLLLWVVFLLFFSLFFFSILSVFLDSKGSVVLQQRWAASPPTAARRVPWLAGSHQSVASHWLARSIDGTTGLSCCVCAFYYHGNHVFHVLTVCLPV